MPVLADNDVIVHRDAQRPGDVDDRLGHVDVGARRRRIALRMVVHQDDGGGGELERPFDHLARIDRRVRGSQPIYRDDFGRQSRAAGSVPPVFWWNKYQITPVVAPVASYTGILNTFSSSNGFGSPANQVGAKSLCRREREGRHPKAAAPKNTTPR